MFPAELSGFIKAEAQKEGFDMCGITHTGELKEQAVLLNAWLSRGCHGDMDYMDRNSGKRTDPSLLVPGSKTVIVVALNYYTPQLPEESGAPVIARYASGIDYHIVMKEKLNNLFAILKLAVPSIEGRVFVDTAPVMEKALAVRAGLGRQGKNSLLLTEGGGSFFFLGEIIINLEAAYDDQLIGDPCGSCTKCIDACPTGAITSDGYLDARNCISYLTIENRDDIPLKFKGKLSNYVYGCDICQEVCPHNLNSKPHQVSGFKMNSLRQKMTSESWDKLSSDQFTEMFQDSAVNRIGYEKFMRNLRF